MATGFARYWEQLFERLVGSIPFVCQDWASTKATYRFFANESGD